MNILIAGGTGFIGRNLCKKLLNDKHEIFILTRDKNKAKLLLDSQIKIIDWDNLKSLSENLSFDCIINLTGFPIADHRWNKKTKQKILESRINSTRALVSFLKNQYSANNTKPTTFINSSAIGYYGADYIGGEIEQLTTNKDFLSEVCRKWESEAYEAEKYGARVVTIRTGIVLGAQGALKRMLLPYRFYLGGPIGSGNQWMSWIHVDDLVNVYLAAISNDKIKGPVNATSPNPVTMKEFCKTLGKVIHKPSWFRVPSFMLILVFGEMADVLLNSQKVYPEKLNISNFKFKFPSLSEALKEIITN
jgi:uncharacterized protein